MTPNWPWTLNSEKYFIHTKNLPHRPHFALFRSTISRFRYTCTRSSKIGNAPNDPKLNFEHLTVKSTLYTLNIYLRYPNFDPFRSMISHFSDIQRVQLTVQFVTLLENGTK